MPFHSHHQSSSSSSQQNAQQGPFSATSGIIQASQALGSIGAPTGNLRSINSGTTTAGTDTLYNSTSSNSQPAASEAHSRTASSYGALQSTAVLGQAPTLPSNTTTPYTPRGPSYTRHQSDELHLSPQSTSKSQLGQSASRNSSFGGAPRINLEQASPADTQSQSLLPGALQSGGVRPGPVPSNTTPTLPIIKSNMAQEGYGASPRSAGHSHSYSRSSPNTGYDGQNYAPFSVATGTESGQYSSSSSKYTPQGQQRNVPNTPLGLADIRPRADSTISDSLPGANPYSYDGANAQPTNSNYLAPWAIYAFDWCKWPAQGHDAGKVAVGSYLEDGHNFVS